ncbi:MAG: glycine cleavage system protein GcvH [Verrucomicrobia bacterium]|nr:glycine cleavage system protein GcvH [Verrucomicrobiota bacterium]
MIPKDLRYHKEHEWIRVEDGKATIGVSDFAQEALGDIVYLEIPEIGRSLKQGEEITEIESTKTTSMLYAPVSGKIVAANQSLDEKPELINEDSYGGGWIVTIEMDQADELDQLMEWRDYERFLENEKQA